MEEKNLQDIVPLLFWWATDKKTQNLDTEGYKVFSPTKLTFMYLPQKLLSACPFLFEFLNHLHSRTSVANFRGKHHKGLARYSHDRKVAG